MKLIVLAALLGIGCHKQSDATDNGSSASPQGHSTAARPAPTGSAAPHATGGPVTIPPKDRAKQLLDAQLAALSSGDDDAIVATLAKDAIALVPDARAVADPTIGLRSAIARLSPHATLKSAKVAKMAAGGNDAAIWLSAVLELTQDNAEPEQKPSTETRHVRITELATADTGWKVVAAAATEATTPMPSKAAPAPITGATEAGPLAALLAAPVSLDKALSSDASVAAFGTDDKESALGPAAAHALLAKWKSLNLSLEGKPREVRAKTWGYVQANVNWQKPGKPYPSRMSAMLIAVPAADGSWAVVAVQYAAQ